VDYGGPFNPFVKLATIQIVLSLALSKEWPIHQLYVKNAFLHVELKETVYIYQPLGFKDPSRQDHIFLRKNHYMASS
jgi:hypothetical protein